MKWHWFKYYLLKRIKTFGKSKIHNKENKYSILLFKSDVINFMFFDLCNYDGSSTTLQKINYKDNLFP